MVGAVHQFRPTHVEEYRPKKEGFLKRHVRWLKQDRRGIANIGVKALVALEATLSVATVVGTKFVIDAVNLSNELDAQNAFFRHAMTVAPPDIDEHFEEKSLTRTFNHVTEFAIENGIIWCRRLKSRDRWVPVYFKGTPEIIHSDGANLIVVDRDAAGDYVVHYKKVLTEYRREELKEVKGGYFQGPLPKDVKYFAVDKSTKINWKSRWFTLPGVHHIVNLINGKELHISSDCLCISISHRGRYNNFVEDRLGQPHPVGTGVTTLYVLLPNGQDIPKFDPWSPTCTKTVFHLPETATTYYKAKWISTSASTIMAVGHEIDKFTGEKRVKIVTRLADIDTEGWNPGLKYAYFRNPKSNKVRVLPFEEAWQEHPLELHGDAAITKDITLIQTGEGNNARELRVDGWNEKGEWGFYWKRIDEASWHFDVVPDKTGEGKIPLTDSDADENLADATVHDFRGSMTNGKETYDVIIKDFGKRSYHSTFQVNINNTQYNLKLHKRVGWKSFLGLKSYKYELVIPEELHKNRDVQKVFGNKHVFKMKIVSHDGHTVKIRGPR